jgi:hypothetical protein
MVRGVVPALVLPVPPVPLIAPTVVVIPVIVVVAPFVVGVTRSAILVMPRVVAVPPVPVVAARVIVVPAVVRVAAVMIPIPPGAVDAVRGRSFTFRVGVGARWRRRGKGVRGKQHCKCCGGGDDDSVHDAVSVVALCVVSWPQISSRRLNKG